MRTRMYGLKSALAALGLAVAGVATATTAEASVLHFDLNSTTTTANNQFDANFTGNLSSVHNADTSLNVLIDGVGQGSFGGTNAGTVTIDFSIDFVAGSITGGTLEVNVDLGGGNIDTFTADFKPGGNITSGGSQVGFIITGDFNNGVFSGAGGGNTFGGIDVSYWGNHPSGQNPFGDLLQFGFTPDAGGVDDNSNIDLFIVIPLPAPVWMGLAGLGGVVVLRRRSLQNAA